MRLFCISLLPILALSAAEPADLVVSAGAVLTMDATGKIVRNGAVAVRGGRILAVGPAVEITRRFRARRHIRRPDALLTPGLINGHTHAPMSLLRGIADDVPLQTWLERFIFPAEERNVDEAFVRAGARLAMLEMMLGGITTYADMYYFEHAIAEETQRAGMRAVLGQTIIGFPAPDYKTPQQALEAAERFIRAWRGHPLVTPAVAPRLRFNPLFGGVIVATWNWSQALLSRPSKFQSPIRRGDRCDAARLATRPRLLCLVSIPYSAG